MHMVLRKVSLGVLILLCSVQISLAQGKLTLGAGMGLPELANLSARYQVKQTQLGLSYGSAPWSDDQARSISGDLFIHYGGTSEFSDRKPWYFRATFTNYREESEAHLLKNNFLSARIGKEINFSNRVGMTLDGGLLARISDDYVDKDPGGGFLGTERIDFMGPVFLSLSLGLFVRL